MADPVGPADADRHAWRGCRPVEGWSVQESIYFSFVSGLTIGYGDFAPKTLLGRALAIGIGICGILVTALVAAVAVQALTDAKIGGDE